MAVFERILCVLTLQLNSVIGNQVYENSSALFANTSQNSCQTPVSPVLNLQSAVATLLSTDGVLGGILAFATSASTKQTILRNAFCDTKIIPLSLSTKLPLRRVSNQIWFI